MLAFHREQGDATDFGRINANAAMGHLALRQGVTHEHRVHGLQIELGGEVHDREIFIIKLTMFLRGVAIALHEMKEELAVGLDVAIEIHAHEAVQLQKARINVAHEPGIWKRHLGDDVAAEPVDAASFRMDVHRGGIDPRIDRTAHQHHGMRHVRVLVSLHAGDCREDRHRGLADRKHVHVPGEQMQDRDQVIDVVVEIERTLRHRDHARVDPFGEVDVVIR